MENVFHGPKSCERIFVTVQVMSLLRVSEERAKNLHEMSKSEGEVTPHGDSSAYGLRMTFLLNKYGYSMERA
jgi:hypothetical protein